MGTGDRYDVLVVGCGPVGLYAAYLLGCRGIRTLIVDKHHIRRGQPKAHALNPRTLEIFQQTGLDASHIRQMGIAPEKVDCVRFMSSFYGWEFGHLAYERQFDDVKNLSPEPLINVAQPLVEGYLAAQVTALSSVTVKRGIEWKGADEDGDQSVSAQARGIVSTLVDRANDGIFTVSTRYLVACDGARATSRQVLGVEFESVDSSHAVENHHITTHFTAPLPGKQSGILFFNMQPHGVRAFIRYGENDWVFVRRFKPADVPDPAGTFDADTCRHMIHEALGRHADDLNIIGTTIWSSSTKVASLYRSPKIRGAFLAGDAAHTFPPTGGLGVNTGIADVHNLVWKVHAVMGGECSDDLLDSYDAERRPVAIRNAKLSASNEAKMDKLGSVINPAGSSATKDTRWMEEDFKTQVAAAVQDNAEHFDSLGYQLGYVYGTETSMSTISNYVPQAATGARLPHTFVTSSDTEMSILGLISPFTLTLLVPNEQLANEVSATMTSGLSKWIQTLVLVQDFVAADKTWLDLVFGPSRDRMVLVRPDQHIAGFPDSMSSLSKVFTHALPNISLRLYRDLEIT